MPGTITGIINRIPTQMARPQVVELVLTCTADVSAHDYPITIVNALANIADFDIRGLKLYSMAQKPGTTGPTDHSSLTLTDKYGIDFMGGNGANFLRNSVASRYMLDPALAFIITGDITLTITGNNVNSAVSTLVLELLGC